MSLSRGPSEQIQKWRDGLNRTGRTRHSRKKQRRPRKKIQQSPMAPPDAQFHLQAGKIESGLFFGPHLPSFWFWSNPPDPDFAPFYRRALSGDLRALVDFYRTRGSDRSPAFYQCIGFLAACGSAEEAKTVQQILSINLRGGPQRTGSTTAESVRNWEELLLPPAQLTANWISQQRMKDRAENCLSLNRERLWQEYVDQNSSSATPGIRQHLDSGIEAQERIQPLYRILESANPSRKQLRALVLTLGETNARKQDIRKHITEIALAHGTIPKELLLELARTTPTRLSPSVAPPLPAFAAFDRRDAGRVLFTRERRSIYLSHQPSNCERQAAPAARRRKLPPSENSFPGWPARPLWSSGDSLRFGMFERFLASAFDPSCNDP